MGFPTATVDGTNNQAISWFSGAVPIDPGVEVQVNAQGFSANPVDLGFGTPLRSVNVSVTVTALNGASSVVFTVQTSPDGVQWFDNATHDSGPVTGPTEVYIHFMTRNRYMRMSWTGSDNPDNNNPADYPAGTYKLLYLAGAYNANYGATNNWVIGTNITNTASTPAASNPLTTAPGNEGNIGGVIGSFTAPKTTEAAAEAYWQGYTQEFQHAGGPIGLYGSNWNQGQAVPSLPATTVGSNDNQNPAAPGDQPPDFQDGAFTGLTPVWMHNQPGYNLLACVSTAAAIGAVTPNVWKVGLQWDDYGADTFDTGVLLIAGTTTPIPTGQPLQSDQTEIIELKANGFLPDGTYREYTLSTPVACNYIMLYRYFDTHPLNVQVQLITWFILPSVNNSTPLTWQLESESNVSFIWQFKVANVG
jgi:hypothetical protein